MTGACIIIEIDEEDGRISSVWSSDAAVTVNILHRVRSHESDYDDWKDEIQELEQKINDLGMVEIY